MARLGFFLLGGAVGAGLALLFAPRSGEETRAIVADKADEYWGKGREFYDQGVTRIQSTYAEVQPQIAKKGDELREKIDNARSLIAEQVAKNAANAREVLNDKMPGATEKLNQAADAVRDRIDTAAGKIKEIAHKPAKDAAGADVAADVVEAALAPAAEAPVATPLVLDAKTPVIPGIAGSQDASKA